MNARRIAAAVAASAACFAMLASAPSAGASTLEVYDSGGSGDGIVATFAIKPSIFDPLLQAGALHTETEFNSAGGGTGRSLSAPAFPGSFAVGAVKGAIGCAGLPGGWLFGTYPPYPTCPTTQEFVAADSNKALNVTAGPPETQAAFQTLRDHVRFKIVHAYAHADLGEASSFVKTAEYSVVQDDKTPAIATARDVSVTNSGVRTDSLVSQTIQVDTKDVEILGGLIKIGSILSTASTASDGINGVAEGSFTMKDVTVTINGATHHAHIDESGITVDDTNQRESLTLNEALHETLIDAGISIRASNPIQVIDGPQAEESVAGLEMTFAASPPAVVIPSQVAPVYAQIIDAIPTKCVYELVPPQVDQVAHVPLCFNGAAILPGSHSIPTFSLSFASVDAFSVAGQSFSEFGGGGSGSGGCCAPSNLTGDTGTSVLGEHFGNGSTGNSYPCCGVSSGGGSEPSVGTGGNGATPLGLVARMPSTLPLIGGALFLVLAVALALGPSLRHARSR